MAAAVRRKRPRKQQRGSALTLLWIATVAALIFTLFHCASNYDPQGDLHPRLETCRLTCDERLQSAALESNVPSSLSSSSMDVLFLSRGPRQQSFFQARSDRPSDGSRTEKLKPTQQVLAATRPRRLPTLIKILTGFGDEPNWKNPSTGSVDSSAGNSKPIIARVNIPHFVAEARRRHASAIAKPLSHEETVQMAAVAAASAVWSKSLRIFGNHRMQRINSEWDAALRWIAGWDQRQQVPSSTFPPPLDGLIDVRSIRVNDSVPPDGGEATDASQEGFNSFVDDLARMLDSCISQCINDENFDDQARNHNEGPSGIDVTASTGEMGLRSFIHWIIGCSFPKLSFKQLCMASVEGITFLNKTFPFITSSVAACYIFYGLTWAPQAVFHWYSSLSYNESPGWLLEHEKEIQVAKSSRARQRKKTKRRELTKQPGGRSRSAPSNDGSKMVDCRAFKGTYGVDDLPQTNSDKAVKSAPPNDIAGTKFSSIQRTQRWHTESDSDDPAPFSTDSVSDSQGSSSTEDVPSMISCQSTSVTSFSLSPSFQPTGRHLEDPEEIPYISSLQGRSQPVLGLNSNLVSPGQLVPTQEQRDEAAKQLREFQNAQIQRLLRQRQLSMNWSDKDRSSTSTAQSGLLNVSSSHSVWNSSIALSLSSQQNKIPMPPPGLVHPSENQTLCNSCLQNQNEKGFPSHNELFLSKLLDDEEDDVKVKPPSSVRIARPISPVSSLDPSAAPFVSLSIGGAQQSISLFTKSEKDTGDAWQSIPGDISLKSSSPTRVIKGVYGGSVW
ncbi:hypothetical protein ACHAXA_005286 [Cyclostephanos tholiformis]|uniref:Uncharacterized protein n=1 Tax=Cyclostephanos tholiformis TaxID=382380 RepID=A0ABD3RB44_9STRA